MCPKTRKKINDRAGFIACYIFAFACLVASIYHTKQLLHLINNGSYTTAIVIDIKTGAKGSKKAIYQFYTETGKKVTASDIFLMYLYRHHKGDEVIVIYDPLDTDIITAETGLWKWEGTIIFGLSFIFLSVLGVLIIHYRSRMK